MHTKTAQGNKLGLEIGTFPLAWVIENAVVSVVKYKVISFDMDDRHPQLSTLRTSPICHPSSLRTQLSSFHVV
ncbi:UNVERIFIED_ORG: hypothetical protein GGI57_001051 [Rhizobium aethiopicum]